MIHHVWLTIANEVRSIICEVTQRLLEKLFSNISLKSIKCYKQYHDTQIMSLYVDNVFPILVRWMLTLSWLIYKPNINNTCNAKWKLYLDQNKRIGRHLWSGVVMVKGVGGKGFSRWKGAMIRIGNLQHGPLKIPEPDRQDLLSIKYNTNYNTYLY